MRYQLPRGYRRYLLGLAMLALLCIAAAVTVFFVPVQKQQPQAQYLLKDNAGRLALYTPDGTGPLAQYDVYTRLLPEPDCLALQQGVSIIPKPNCSKNWKITACSPLYPVCACVAGHLWYTSINKMW